MTISVENLGKRYNRDWIFRHLSFQFELHKHYAITGPNGSGKSTLLQVIGGSTIYNEGAISYSASGQQIDLENTFKKMSFTAPYLELVEEMTLSEFLAFHGKMKGWIGSLDAPQIIALLGLQRSSNKQIRYFSSGMKQRVKLAQAIFSDVSTILLDEPLTNLDDSGISLYHLLIKNYCQDRMVIVSSNDKNEYSFCEEVIEMTNYK